MSKYLETEVYKTSVLISGLVKLLIRISTNHLRSSLNLFWLHSCMHNSILTTARHHITVIMEWTLSFPNANSHIRCIFFQHMLRVFPPDTDFEDIVSTNLVLLSMFFLHRIARNKAFSIIAQSYAACVSVLWGNCSYCC